MRKYTNCWLNSLVLIFVTSSHLLAQIDHKEYGFIKFDFNLDDVFIMVDDDLVGAFKYDPEQLVRLEAGEKKITVIHKDINDFNYRINIYPDSTIGSGLNILSFTRNPRSSYDVLNEGRNVIINTEPEGQIYINNKLHGVGSSSVLLQPGKHKLEILHPRYGSLEKELSSSFYYINEINRYNQNHQKPKFAARLIPGYSYLNNKDYLKSGLTYAGLLSLGMFFIQQNNDYKNLEKNFFQLEEQYLNSTSIQEVVRLRGDIDQISTSLDSKKKTIDRVLIAGTVLYLITTIDGFRKPKAGYTGNKIQFNIANSEFMNTSNIGFSIVKNF